MDPPRRNPATGRLEILVESEGIGSHPAARSQRGWVGRSLRRGRFVDKGPPDPAHIAFEGVCVAERLAVLGTQTRRGSRDDRTRALVSTSIQLPLAVVTTLLLGAQAQIEHRVNPFASSCL